MLDHSSDMIAEEVDIGGHYLVMVKSTLCLQRIHLISTLFIVNRNVYLKCLNFE